MYDRMYAGADTGRSFWLRAKDLCTESFRSQVIFLPLISFAKIRDVQ